MKTVEPAPTNAIRGIDLRVRSPGAAASLTAPERRFRCARASVGPGLERRVERAQHMLPGAAEAPCRQRERHVLVVRVEQQQEAVVGDRLAARAAVGDLVAVEEHAQHVGVAALPVPLRHLRPSGRNHQTSGSPDPLTLAAGQELRAAKHRVPAAQLDQPPRERRAARAGPRRSSQSNQESSLSWHHALLLPCWVRPSSSPPSSIGTPCESSSVARKLRCWRQRSALISGSSVSPSTPQFHERLSSVPSRLSSPLASLCLSL